MLLPSGRAFKIVPGNGYQTYPNAGPLALTLAAWSGAGTWVEAEASTSVPIYVCGMGWTISTSATNARSWELDIGLGAAASEVAIATISGVSATSEPATEYMAWLPIPVAIPAGSRLSMRCRQSIGTTGRVPQNTRLIYVAQSEVVPL